MKIIYCIHSIYNPGGMERVLLNKVSYLIKEKGYDITIITTDQKGRAPFYTFPEMIKMIDLDINYSDDNQKHTVAKIVGYLKRRYLHKKRLTDILMKEKADIVISLYPSESSFICNIKDGSKKILELHYCKFFRLQYNRKGILGFIDKFRTKQDESIVKKFDKFIVLSNEDKGYWGKLKNIDVIANSATIKHEENENLSNKRVIAVGRLDYQKSFDRLIEAWRIIHDDKRYNDWSLEIFGQGEWQQMLQTMIDNYGMQEQVHINKPTKKILKEYAQSDMLVMSSHYEGFPMVMIEAMSCGIPVVSFDFKCGPRDIIEHGVNGLLVNNGDIEGLANALMQLMGNEEYRKQLSSNTKKIITTYSEENIMNKWTSLFESLLSA